MARRLELTVPPELDGARVGDLLRGQLGLSGSALGRIKRRAGAILLDGQSAHPGVRAAAGQALSVDVAEPERPADIPPWPGQGEMVYEDEDLLVVNKPAGLLCHPAPGQGGDTLAGRVMYELSRRGEEPGCHLVHRLDRGTSGLVIMARHPHAQERLKGLLHTSAFTRTYLAVCDGVPSPAAGVVEAPIGRAPHSILARQVDPAGQAARTRYRVLGEREGRALVELVLDTGRTHQIRVHMAHLGCPLTGDWLYGREDRALIPRPALHAWEIALTHPITGEARRWRAPLPEDMAALVGAEIRKRL